MPDQVVTDIGTEGEDMRKPAQRFAFSALERLHRLIAESGGMDVVGPRQRPAMIAVEVVLHAATSGSRQIEGAGMKDMSRAETIGGFRDLLAEPAPSAQAAQDLLAAERPAE